MDVVYIYHDTIDLSLIHIFLSICDDMDITDAIPDMEEADGSAYLLEQLNSAIGNGEFIDKIQYEPHEPGDVLMLTGVGEVFPFMRIHTLLEALQPYFSDVPILVMYPGEFDGRHVKLFNRCLLYTSMGLILFVLQLRN